MEPRPSQRIAIAIVAVAAVLPYLGLLGQPLVYDAPRAIVDNPALAHGSLATVLATDFWGLPLDAQYASRSYRPLVSTTWWLGLRAFGTAPWALHVGDVLLHAAGAVLVLLLAGRLGIARPWSIAAGLVYSLHPVQTEAVASAVGRADLMAAGFLLAALVLHLDAGSPGVRRPALREALALACIAAALLSKEYAVTFPFVLVAVDLGQRVAGRRSAPLRPWVWAGAFALLVGYLGLRLALFGALGGVPMLTEVDHPLVGQPFSVRAATAARLVVLAARILVWPAWPNHHYRAGTLPIVPHLTDPRALGGLLLVAAIVGGAALWLVRRRDAVRWTAAMLFVLPLVPGLNLAGPGGVLFAERFLVLPCAGLGLLVAHAAAALGRRGRAASFAAASVLLVLSVAMAARSVARVSDWASDERLARSSIASWPGSHETWRDLGLALAGAGRDGEAIGALERATALEPRDAQAWHALAGARTRVGRLDEAAEAWQQAVDHAPRSSPALLAGLGQALLQAGRADDAIDALERARQLAGDDPAIRSLLAATWLEVAGQRALSGLDAAALDAARHATALDALPGTGWLAAGWLADRAGDPTTARSWFDRALALDPDVLRDQHERALALESASRTSEAIEAWRAIVRVDPTRATAWFNLGRMLLAAGQPAEAEEALARGLALAPDPRARELLERARRGGR